MQRDLKYANFHSANSTSVRRHFLLRLLGGISSASMVACFSRVRANDSALKDSVSEKGNSKTSSTGKSKGDEEEIDYLSLTDEQWKKRLTNEQFRVARKHGTERAFSGKYYNHKKDGAYKCVCCNTVVFDSKEKFDSGTGWPSFWQPKESELVEESVDNKLNYPRTEVHCTKCHAHLGHVFNDAPQTPTGLRYCINSVCIVFVPRKSSDKEKK